MTPDEIVREVRGMVFKPGWSLSAQPYLGMFVLVELFIDTVDTSFPDADGICRKRVRLYRDTLLDPKEITSIEDICHAILKLANETDEHENREFLKVRRPDGSWYAPMHPHTTEGESAWKRRQEGAKT